MQQYVVNIANGVEIFINEIFSIYYSTIYFRRIYSKRYKVLTFFSC